LIVAAGAAVTAQKVSAKAQVTADKKFFEYTLHILSSLSFRGIRTHAALKVKATCREGFVNC
jgi:hypothetical protein